MNVLFINGSPNPDGRTARLAAALLAGRSYETIELGTTKLYDYGQHFADDQFDEVLASMEASDTIVIGSPLYWHSFSGMVRNLIDRCYGTCEDGRLAGKRLWFIFQGYAPTAEQLANAEYTLKRFASLYQLEWCGMVTNEREAVDAARQV